MHRSQDFCTTTQYIHMLKGTYVYFRGMPSCLPHNQPRKENLGSEYEIHIIKTRPQDMGFHSISRERNYHLLVHKRFGRFLQDPTSVYQRIADRLKGYKDVLIQDLFWEDDPHALKEEVLSSLPKSRLHDQSLLEQGDWTPFLSKWEQENIDKYTQKWMETHSSMTDAVFVLNQNPDHRKMCSGQTGDDPPHLPTV